MYSLRRGEQSAGYFRKIILEPEYLTIRLSCSINILMRRFFILLFLLTSALPLFCDDADVPEAGENDSIVPSLPVIKEPGTILLNNTGEKGEFHVYLDGSLIASDITELTNISLGSHYIEIKQIRFGLETLIIAKNLQLSDSETVSFEIPYLLKDEYLNLGRIKKNIDSAIQQGSSLSGLKRELEVLINSFGDLAFCPALIHELKILEDYLLKIQLDRELGNAIFDYNSGITVNLSFFKKEYDFYMYDSKSGNSESLFKKVFEQVLILKRLEALIPLAGRNFEEFLLRKSETDNTDLYQSLVSPRFSTVYKMDSDLLASLYQHYVEERRAGSRKKLRSYLENYYGDILITAESISDNKMILDKKELLALKASYSQLEPVKDFTGEEYLEQIDHFQFSTSVGGGSLLTVGFLWRPWKWLGVRTGISGSYNFDSNLDFALSLELDIFILQNKFKLYLGPTADLFRVSNYAFTSDNSYFRFISALGANLGFSLSLGKIEIFLNNYLYVFPDDSSGNDSLIYSPSLGVLF